MEKEKEQKRKVWLIERRRRRGASSKRVRVNQEVEATDLDPGT